MRSRASASDRGFWHASSMGERRPKNSQLRLKRLAEEAEEAPEGILELFPERDDAVADEDAALTREEDEPPQQ